MAGKKKIRYERFSEKDILQNRRFPVRNTVLLVLCVLVQIVFLLAALCYTPEPQDVIREYAITVEPLDDGSLDMEYSFVWTALDENEALTWVEIGMPNSHFTIERTSFSSTISHAEKYVDGDYCSARLYFTRAYVGGETVEFSFKINQRQMLCKSANGNYFYHLIPGWFNATPVEHYTFRWKSSDDLVDTSTATERLSYYVWEGEMPMGTYVSLHAIYDTDAFADADTVEYVPFDDEGVYDQLAADKTGIVVFAVIVILGVGIFEMYIADSYVSYHRGRGFLTGYGHHVHHYGRVNPRYRSEAEKRAASSHRSGGGCACACACACAGGGRAGCSQKNTYDQQKK